MSIIAQSKDVGAATLLNIWNQEVNANLVPDPDLKLARDSQSSLLWLE